MEEGGGQFVGRGAGVLEEVARRGAQPPAADAHHLEGQLRALPRPAPDVAVLGPQIDDPLPLQRPPDGRHLVAEPRRLLELQALRGIVHPLLQAGDHLPLLAAQILDRPLHRLAVPLLVDQADAGGQALADLVVEAGPGAAAEVGVAAVAQGEDGAHRLERLLQGLRGGVGAEVERAVVRPPAGDGAAGSAPAGRGAG